VESVDSERFSTSNWRPVSEANLWTKVVFPQPVKEVMVKRTAFLQKSICI
jgi:hypothetical protein